MSSVLGDIQNLSDQIHKVVKGDCQFRIFHLQFIFPSIRPEVIVVAITNSSDNLEWLGIQHQQHEVGDYYRIAVFQGQFNMYEELLTKQKAMEFPECEKLVQELHIKSLKKAIKTLEVRGWKVAEAQELLQKAGQQKQELEEVETPHSLGLLGTIIRSIIGALQI